MASFRAAGRTEIEAEGGFARNTRQPPRQEPQPHRKRGVIDSNQAAEWFGGVVIKEPPAPKRGVIDSNQAAERFGAVVIKEPPAPKRGVIDSNQAAERFGAVVIKEPPAPHPSQPHAQPRKNFRDPAPPPKPSVKLETTTAGIAPRPSYPENEPPRIEVIIRFSPQAK